MTGQEPKLIHLEVLDSAEVTSLFSDSNAALYSVNQPSKKLYNYILPLFWKMTM